MNYTYLKRFCLVLLVFCCLNIVNAYGDDTEIYDNALFDNYDVDEITDYIKNDEELNEFNVKKIVTQFISGDISGAIKSVGSEIYEILFKSIVDNTNILKQVIILVLLSAIFTNFTNVLKNGQVAGTGFYICYMITIALVISSYTMITRLAEISLERMIDFMKALIPVYVVSVGVSEGNAQASSYYQLTIIIIFIVSSICKKVILPLINIYIIIHVVGNIYEENYLSKTAELIEKSCSFMIKTMLILVTGLNVIRRMFEPITGTYKNATRTTMEVLSGLNGTGINVAELVYGTGNIVKNTIGGIGVTILFLIIIIPIIKIIVFIFMYQLTNAIIEPVSDKRLVKCFEGITKGTILILRMIVAVSLMFIITITIMCINSQG